MSKYLGDVSAYAYAVSQGYTGTEQEFAELMASYATVAESAAASASAAADSASAASTSATQAGTAATNAAGSESAAGQYASQAQTAAGAAAQSRTDAAASATPAAGSASQAALSATQAANSAQSASTSATDADAAKMAAVAAQAAAETAQGKAEDAQGAAEDAQTAAEAAAQGVQSSLDQISQNTSDIGDLQTAMETKAEIDGYYEEMTVGDAEQLVATQYVEDSVPYLYRTTGGTADVGNREYVDKIVGGTVAWNQLAQIVSFERSADGITVSISNGLVSITGTSTKESGYINVNIPDVWARLTNGHAYLINIVPQTDSGTTTMSTLFLMTGNGGSISCYEKKSGTIVKQNAETTGNSQLYIRPYYTFNGTLKYYYGLVDLTALFGTTIADYIYQLEQTTAGAGVAWFRKLFPNMDAEYSYLEDPSDETSVVTKKLRDYEAGILLSVEGVSAHETVGFNQWDGEYENGYINADTGENIVSTNNHKRSSYIEILPNTTYYFRRVETTINNGIYCYYDADKNFISSAIHTKNTTFVTPSNARYMRFAFVNCPIIAQNDICINLSWSGTRNGEYLPYQKHSYPLDSSLVLRGIPKLDAANNLYYDGDEYLPDGTVNRRYGIVDLGTLNWFYLADNKFYYLSLTKKKPGNNMIVPGFVTKTGTWTTETVTENITWGNPSNNTIYFRTSNDYPDAAAFKTAMSGVYLVYELATPTTETAEPYQEIQICDDWGTEEYVSTGMVPIGHETHFPSNLRDKLQHLPSLADSDGYYMINQTNSQMTLERFRIPKAPATDGTYTLKATVSGGTPTYTWEAVE